MHRYCPLIPHRQLEFNIHGIDMRSDLDMMPLPPLRWIKVERPANYLRVERNDRPDNPCLSSAPVIMTWTHEIEAQLYLSQPIY